MLILRTINTNTANNLGISSFNKMYITNPSTVVGDNAIFTLQLMQTGIGSGLVDVKILSQVNIPVGVTIELDGYKQGPAYTGADIPNPVPLSVRLFATAHTGEVDLLIEADTITEN